MIIVQVNYAYDGDPAEWAKAYTEERAKMFVDLLGLVWKIWLDAPDENRTGGYTYSMIGSRPTHT